jgi:archaetidylinositol phosphate synthase
MSVLAHGIDAAKEAACCKSSTINETCQAGIQQTRDSLEFPARFAGNSRLYQGLPRGIRSPFVVSPKRSNTPVPVAPRRTKRYGDFMPTQPFRDAERQQLSLLAAVEKKTLIWLAHRMPAWVNSDHLTLLGFVAMFVAGLCYWAARWDRRALIGVILALAVNWFGDSLDGTLARVRNRLRPRYGFYVDHVTDAIGTFFLIGGLGLSGYMSLDIALGLLVAYFMLSIEVYLTTYTIGTFHLSFWSFGPTELRLLLCIGNIALFYRPQVVLLGRRWLLFDIGGAVGIAGMALMLVWAAVRHTRQLYQAERLP